MHKIRIVVVDDHEVVRHGLRLSIDSEPDMEVVDEARAGEEAVRVVVAARPDVVLLDVKLEDKDIDGPEVCRRVMAAVPKTAVLMLTSYLQDGVLLRSLVAGAKGYVVKDVELTELKRMIRLVYRGGSVLDPRATPRVIATATAGRARPATPATVGDRAAALSDIDLSIIRYLSQGLTNKEIAARVHLSPYTVKDHLDKIREILDVRSRTEVVTKALSTGLILPA
jgi:two-component system, NarL family, response regulator DevR